MNLAFIIIGVPTVAVAALYTAAFWGRSIGAIVAIGLTLLFLIAAAVDYRRRRAAQELNSGQNRTPVSH